MLNLCTFGPLGVVYGTFTTSPAFTPFGTVNRMEYSMCTSGDSNVRGPDSSFWGGGGEGGGDDGRDDGGDWDRLCFRCSARSRFAAFTGFTKGQVVLVCPGFLHTLQHRHFGVFVALGCGGGEGGDCLGEGGGLLNGDGRGGVGGACRGVNDGFAFAPYIRNSSK